MTNAVILPVLRTHEDRMKDTVEVLCQQLRPEAHGMMESVTRAAIDDENGLSLVPLARRVLDSYDVDLTTEVFVLSLQAHYNIYYDLALAVIEPHSKDAEADTLGWLCVHYIVAHPQHLTKAT